MVNQYVNPTHGENVNIFNHHGLSCKKSAGRRSRHEMVNDLLKRAFVSCNIPSVREPSGCNRSDGKRPDGLTLIPWNVRKCLIWDFTCVDTLAPSYVERSSRKAGEAALLAENRNRLKYQCLESTYIFEPVAIETMGPWGSSAKKLISELGKKIFDTTNEVRSCSFLKQRIIISIQRGKSAAVLGTLPMDDKIDDFYYLI